MTIEQLVGCSADELEKMTDKQLMEYFAPYLDVTRPERAAIKEAAEKANAKQRVRTGKSDPALEAISRLSQLGIDFSKL